MVLPVALRQWRGTAGGQECGERNEGGCFVHFWQVRRWSDLGKERETCLKDTDAYDEFGRWVFSVMERVDYCYFYDCGWDKQWSCLRRAFDDLISICFDA